MRGATLRCIRLPRRFSHFNPHSPCGERLHQCAIHSSIQAISIHTPHAGSDDFPLKRRHSSRNFNPHSPCGERPHKWITQSRHILFQSTLPMRGATGSSRPTNRIMRISIHTPHAGSDGKLFGNPRRYSDFNPHSPCGERLLRFQVLGKCCIFQSTLPMRGATWQPIVSLLAD